MTAIGLNSISIQSVELTADMEKLKQHIQQVLNPSLGGGFGTGAVPAFIVAMMLYQPEQCRLQTLRISCLAGCMPVTEIFSLLRWNLKVRIWPY